MLLYLKREWISNGNIAQVKRKRLKKKAKKKRNRNFFKKTCLSLMNLLPKRKAKMMRRKLRLVRMKIKKKMKEMLEIMKIKKRKNKLWKKNRLWKKISINGETKYKRNQRIQNSKIMSI